MVAEPTSAVQTAIAAISVTILTLLGVTFHSLLWAMLGSLVSLMFAKPIPKSQAVAAVFCGMLCGAVMADMFVAIAITALPAATANGIKLGMAFLIGGGAKELFSAGIAFLVKRANPGGSPGSQPGGAPPCTPPQKEGEQ